MNRAAPIYSPRLTISWSGLPIRHIFCFASRNHAEHNGSNNVPRSPYSWGATRGCAPFIYTNAKQYRDILRCISSSFSFFLVSSIALLKRKNWGRVSIVALLCLTLFSILGSSIASMFNSPEFIGPHTQTQAADEFDQLFTIFYFVNLALMFVVSGILGWIAYRLCTRTIRGQFS